MVSDRRIFKKTGALLLGLTYSIISFGSENIKEAVSSSESVENVNMPKSEPKLVASSKTNNSQLEKLIKNQYNNKSIDLNVNTSLRNMRDSGSYERPNVNTYTANRKTQQGTPDMKLSKEQLLAVAERIFQNETGGVRNNLVDWNDGENFPSLGIGHFTWFKASGGRSGFGDSLPDMIAYYKQQGIQLPKLLSEFRYSPWNSKSELMAKKANGDKDIQELMQVLKKEDLAEIKVRYGKVKLTLTNSETLNTVNNQGSTSKKEEKETPKPALPVEEIITSGNVGKIKLLSSKTGTVVKKGQILAKVNTMGIDNEVKSTVNGILTEILVADGSAVDFAKELFKIEV